MICYVSSSYIKFNLKKLKFYGGWGLAVVRVQDNLITQVKDGKQRLRC